MLRGARTPAAASRVRRNRPSRVDPNTTLCGAGEIGTVTTQPFWRVTETEPRPV